MALTLEGNRNVLRALVDTILFCCKEVNHQFYCNSGEEEYYAMFSAVEQNCGMLIKHLTTKAETNTDVKLFLQQLKEARGTINNMIPDTICEIIECIGNGTIVQSIVKDIESSKYFSFFIETHTYYAGFTPLCVRYVGSGNVIKEEVIHWEWDLLQPKRDGKAIANIILSVLQRLGLDMTHCCSIGYNGISALFPENLSTDVSESLMLQLPQALYLQSPDQGFSIAVCCNTDDVKIREHFRYLRCLINFFTKDDARASLLNATVMEDNPTPHKVVKKRSLTDVRWTVLEEMFPRFLYGYKYYVIALRKIKDDLKIYPEGFKHTSDNCPCDRHIWDIETRHDAADLLECIGEFDSLMTYVIMNRYLHVYPFTELDEKMKDSCNGFVEVYDTVCKLV